MSKLRALWSKISGKRTSEIVTEGQSVAAQDSVQAKRKQDSMIWIFLGIILIGMIIWIRYKSNKGETEPKLAEKSALKLEVASQALDSEKMWRNYFEDKLIETTNKTQDKLQLIESSINEQSVAYQNQLKSEIEKLKEQMRFLAEEQALAKREFSSVKLKSEQEDKDSQSNINLAGSKENNITVNHMDRGEIFDRPKSSRNFIPETAYVKGILLGGIAVSTSMGSSSEPVPVIIRITDRGNLPKNFNIDLTHCQIMGSSYGDLSSERAVVRAEVLSCHDPKKELIYTTKVAGLIYGDDGMNGIKGRVIQTSDKHLKNAIVGSMISGFAQSAKGQDQFAISSIGAVSTKKKGAGEMIKEGGLAGASSAAEKIADYYIKQAESMSPVLLISGGTKVDIVFTKGVYLGALDVQEKLDQYRNEKAKK